MNLLNKKVRFILLLFFISAGIFLGSSKVTHAYTAVSYISSNTTWTKENSPYVVTGSVTVPSTITLTIEPGAIVKFKRTSDWPQTLGVLIVDGVLKADATPQDQIYFTSFSDDTVGGDTNGDGAATAPITGVWGETIRLTNPASPSVFNNVYIKYNTYGLWIKDGIHQITNVHLIDNLYGIVMEGGNIEVTNAEIINNISSGIYVLGGTFMIKNSSIHNNSQGLYVQLASVLSVDARNNWWGDQSGPHHLLANIGGKGNGVGGVWFTNFSPWLKSEPTQQAINQPPPGATLVPAISSPITIGPIPKTSEPGTLLNVVFNKDTNTVSYNPVSDNNDLNPDFSQKPTTIIVHGWNPDGSAELPDWVESMSSWLVEDELKRTNVLVWEWIEEASTLLPPNEYLMEQQGDYLADKLSNIFKTSGYANKIHFIGHSAGARVAYTAGANLIADNIPVDLLTTLDAYMFDAVDFTTDLTVQAITGVSTNDFLKNTESFFKFYPLNLFNFVDNYWFTVGALSYKAELGFLSNSIFSGVNPLVVDGLLCPPGLKDKITNHSYFIENNILDDLHKPPVNWYMASMVNHLPVSLLEPSPNSSEHNYGFYWSPIFNNERPNKLDIDLLFGCESYFDLIGSPAIVSDAVVKFDELVKTGIDLANRLKERAKIMGKNLIIKAVDEFSDASGWISNKSNVVYHYAENNLNGWLWATTQSPTVFSKNYLIPSGTGWLGFSYEVLQGGQESTLEIFINDTLIFYKIFKQEKTNGIILSDLIDVGDWSGDDARLSFRINGSNVAPFIIKMHDIFFVEIEFMPKDSDNDNILDVWELLYWNDLSHSGDSDFDNDGLNNMDEFLFGTNPTKFSDIIAPTTNISILGTLGNNDWYTSDVEIILSAKDNEGGVGVEKTLYSLDNEKWNTYSTTSPIRITDESAHTIQYYSIDWFGNKEATSTQEIKIDKTPPEAKILFDQNLKQLKIEGTDNLSSVAVIQNNKTYTLTDEAGHTLDVVFNKFKTEGKEIKAEIRALRYDGVSTPAIPENKLQYEWSLEKNDGLKELNQRVEIEKIFDVRARYDGKKNETAIDTKMEDGKNKDEKKIKQTLPGLVLLTLTTNSGNFHIYYDR